MTETNPNSRLEAFCDGVFAIALTLLIIDIKIPSTVQISTSKELWLALQNLLPSLFAFLLSFIIILITWVNHHGHLKLINKSSASFIYANGLLLFTVVFLPFPTALVGEYLFTDHSSPAVIVYICALAAQAIGWILLSKTALRNQLCKDEQSALLIRRNGRDGYYALVTYIVCAFVAFWYPLAVVIITCLIWMYWLLLGLKLKHD